jgi:hypothetical protein
MKFLEAKIDTLQDVLVLESGFGAQLAQAQANVTESAAKAVAAVVEADDVALDKFLAELVDAKDQIAAIAAIKAQAAAFRAGLIVAVPVDPLPAPQPIVIPEPTPVEPTPA